MTQERAGVPRSLEACASCMQRPSRTEAEAPDASSAITSHLKRRRCPSRRSPFAVDLSPRPGQPPAADGCVCVRVTVESAGAVELCGSRCCSSVAFASRVEEVHGEPAYIIRNLLQHLLELRVSERLPQLVALRHHQYHVLQLACLRTRGTREQAAAGELPTCKSAPCRA